MYDDSSLRQPSQELRSLRGILLGTSLYWIPRKYSNAAICSTGIPDDSKLLKGASS
jgi:hypothetical protein